MAQHRSTLEPCVYLLFGALGMTMFDGDDERQAALGALLLSGSIFKLVNYGFCALSLSESDDRGRIQ